jgi:glutaredoxin 3
MNSQAHIRIYGTESCCYCTAARTLLEDKGLSYEHISISGDAAKLSEMTELSGSHLVPQIFINDKHIGGFDELYTLEQSGDLDRLLTRE